jgi:hypothetical protein
MTMLPQDVNIPPEAIHAAIMLGRYFFAGCVILGVVPPVIRLFGRRFERPPVIEAVPSADTTARLERIEQAVDAVAIEVERIAEAQRFSARLMAEKRTPLLAPQSDSGR